MHGPVAALRFGALVVFVGVAAAVDNIAPRANKANCHAMKKFIEEGGTKDVMPTFLHETNTPNTPYLNCENCARMFKIGCKGSIPAFRSPTACGYGMYGPKGASMWPHGDGVYISPSGTTVTASNFGVCGASEATNLAGLYDEDAVTFLSYVPNLPTATPGQETVIADRDAWAGAGNAFRATGIGGQITASSNCILPATVLTKMNQAGLCAHYKVRNYAEGCPFLTDANQVYSGGYFTGAIKSGGAIDADGKFTAHGCKVESEYSVCYKLNTVGGVPVQVDCNADTACMGVGNRHCPPSTPPAAPPSPPTSPEPPFKPPPSAPAS